MTLSYAGIGLYVPTPEQQETIQAWLDSWSDLEFSAHPWPGKDLTGLTFLPTQPLPHPKLGSLYWPFGASRWACGHFLATDAMLAAIRVALAPGRDESGFLNSPIPGLLSMESKIIAPLLPPVVASLYMLPPRPLHQIAGMNGVYLLTLVDQRYYWWYANSGIQPIQSGTTWSDVYDNLGDELGLTIDVDTVNATYGFPAPEFTNYYQSLPTMLDAVAYNCGQRVICQLDGSVSTQNTDTDIATLAANITSLNAAGAKILGGAFDRTDDFGTALPATVVNVTRNWLNDVPSVLDPLFNVASVDLIDQAGFAGIRGFEGVKTFRDTYHGADPDDLATQIAIDYWQRIWSTYLDVVVAHPFNVAPEGLHDIEWSYVIGGASTRIYKTLWNWEPEEFLHGDGNGPFSGNSEFEPFQIQPFFAQVSSPTGMAYPWTEVIPQTGGSWTAKPAGRTGTDSLDPGYEFNGSTTVPAGSIVLMWRGFQNNSSTKQEWLFAMAAGGGGGTTITVQESDGTPICTGITNLVVDSDTMTVTCLGAGSAEISALIAQDVYVLYQDHTLKSVPCVSGIPIAPPYSPTIIGIMKTLPGLDFVGDIHSLYTNPDTGGGSGTIVNCIPANPPPTGYYCHQNPGGNNCSTNPYPETGDTAVVGPYPDATTCGAACAAGPSSYHFYSETPGITWQVIQGSSAGDTGPCTVILKAEVTYPPPNQSLLINYYIGGQGSLYPINLVDSCTINWSVSINDECGTIDLMANWEGLQVYGGSSCNPDDCAGEAEFIGAANSMEFALCDFVVQPVGDDDCSPLKYIKVQTCGATQTLSFQFYSPSDCTIKTFTITVQDGLVKSMSVS